jgi:hypothetical protein
MHTYFYYVVAGLRMGRTCIYTDGGGGIAAVIEKYTIFHVVLLPVTLARVLDILPENYVKTADLTVFSIK